MRCSYNTPEEAIGQSANKDGKCIAVTFEGKGGREGGGCLWEGVPLRQVDVEHKDLDSVKDVPVRTPFPPTFESPLALVLWF